MSGEQRECRKAQKPAHHPRQPVVRSDADRSAWAASRTNGSAFQAKYEQLKPKIGHKRALVAVAHALVKTICYVLSAREPYREVKAEVLNEVKRQRIIRHHTRRLRRPGCWLPAEKLTPLHDAAQDQQ